MGDKKKFLHFLSVNGSGNHLIVDIMKNYNISRISDDLDRLVALLILKKKKIYYAVLDDTDHQNLDEYLEFLFAKINFKIKLKNLSDQEIIIKYIEFISKNKNCFLIHTPGYLIFEQKILSKNNFINFDEEMIIEANDLLDSSLSKIGYIREKIAVIRNPIDIYLSQKERYIKFNNSEACDRINSYFLKISNDNNTKKIFYENIYKIYDLIENLKIKKRENFQKILYQPRINKYLCYLNFDLKKLTKIFEKNLAYFKYTNLPKPSFYQFIKYNILRIYRDTKLVYLIYMKNYDFKGRYNHSNINKLTRLLIKLLKLIKKN